MSAYKFDDPDGLYFLTFTVVEWVDIFSRQDYVNIILDSLRFCQREKGLIVTAWVIMSNHLHLIISREENTRNTLSDIVRDFKKITSSQILNEIRSNSLESRKNWMLWIFKSAGERNRNNKNHQFWKQDNRAELLFSNDFMEQKLDYLHQNPVKAGLVDEAEHYRYSIARDYCGYQGLLEIVLIE
ncbi:transposase [Marinoscillum sp. MHG1-6]|uniref:REP-associated tyrosine transposase n=1 Tax=Marinoscillum sp. MHG1-6 TaxID=2959627 RepID=UPI002158260A|nr:transposase [Marinoscillum sp. MHG1-6]